MRLAAIALGLWLLAQSAAAQTAPAQAPAQADPQQAQAADPPAGPPPPRPAIPDTPPAVAVTDAERSALVIEATDLDLHLTPADAGESAHATLTLRNVSAAALTRVVLQLSSTLHWQGFSLATSAGLKPLPFTQSPIANDADHTGYAEEAVVTLPEPLAAGARLTLSALYSGSVPASAARQEALGAPAETALGADWDAIAPTSDARSTALRGFGNVLWYPVAAPAALLGDANKLVDTVALERLRNASSTLRLRLTVEYTGDPPDSAVLDGHMLPLSRLPDQDSQAVEESQGTATADFPQALIGFRTPSLFLTAQHATSTPDRLLEIVSARPDAADPYVAAAASLRPLLTLWLGAAPAHPMIVLDHPGQRFEDEALLALPFDPAASPAALAPVLVRPLTHAWLHPAAPTSVWLDQGLAEFMGLLWTEKSQGREAALAQLQQAAVLLALAEPDLSQTPATGQPLVTAHSDVYLHFKAASVLWQLRELLGEEPFRRALLAFRHSLALNPALDRDPKAFELALERSSGKDLAWFFDDWVYRDRGLPDLTIVQANPRLLPARPGKNAGYLVAVEVRNDGDAVADVPVTVRSGSLTSTERLRIAAHSSAATRVLFEDRPETVQVNDGSVPELRGSVHTAEITVLR